MRFLSHVARRAVRGGPPRARPSRASSARMRSSEGARHRVRRICASTRRRVGRARVHVLRSPALSHMLRVRLKKGPGPQSTFRTPEPEPEAELGAHARVPDPNSELPPVPSELAWNPDSDQTHELGARPAQAQGLSKQAKGVYVRGVLTRDCDPPVSRVVRAPRPTLQPLPRGTWLPTPRGRTPSALWDPAVSQSRTSGRDELRRGRRKHHRRRRITHARRGCRQRRSWRR